MQPVLTINEDKRESGRDYTFQGRCLVMTTGTFQSPPSGECSVLYLHANDVRANSEARRNIIAWVKSAKVTVVLFTNSNIRGTGVPDFSDQPVYTWEEINSAFPELPSPVSTSSHLTALAILCQGYLAARGQFDLLGIEPVKMPERSPQSARVSAVVMDRNWWLSPFGGDAESLKAAIRRECPTQNTPTEVESLLAKLGDNDDHKVAAALKSILDVLNR